MKLLKYLIGLSAITVFLVIALTKPTYADTQNFVASNVTWDGATLNFDTNVNLNTISSGDPGPYHDLHLLNISSATGNPQYWQAKGDNNISCSATHCTVTDLTNYNDSLSGYVTDWGVSQVQLSFWDSNDELVAQSSSTPWTPIPYGPQLNSVQGANINEGTAYNGSGSFSESNATAWAATVDYGDGTGVQPLTLNSDNTFTLSHVYQSSGTYYVTISVTDNYGKTSSEYSDGVIVHSLPVTVNQFSAALPYTTYKNSTIAASYTYVGPNDRHTATINWGDGSGANPVPLNENGTNGSIDYNQLGDEHTYKSVGTYTITLIITSKDGVSQTATTTVTIKNEPPDFGNASIIPNSSTMIDSQTLSIPLENMPADAYSGIQICEYGKTTPCSSNYIVGSGGITYTVTNGQISNAIVDISPAFQGQTVVISVYYLDSDGENVNGAEGSQVVALTTAPFTVSGINVNGISTSVDVNSNYKINSINASNCALVGVTDGSYLFASGVNTTTNSCDFDTGQLSSFASNNNSFYLRIDNEFDTQVLTTQDYNFSQFIPNVSPPTNLIAPTPTTQSPILSWDSEPGAVSYNIYRNGTEIGSTSTTSYTDTSLTDYGTYNYYVTAVGVIGNESSPSNSVSVNYYTPFTINPITAPSVAGKGTLVNLNATFSDSSSNSPHMASWNWGDGISSTGQVNESSSLVSGSHTYTSAGVFTITLTLTNSAGSTLTDSYQIVVSPKSNGVFSGANLSGLNYSNVNLSNLNISGSNMQNGVFIGTNFQDSNLSGNNAPNANFTNANFTNANLAGSTFQGANFTGANLTGANLKGANLKNATMTNVTWSNTICPDGSNSNNDGGTCVGKGGGL